MKSEPVWFRTCRAVTVGAIGPAAIATAHRPGLEDQRHGAGRTRPMRPVVAGVSMAAGSASILSDSFRRPRRPLKIMALVFRRLTLAFALLLMLILPALSAAAASTLRCVSPAVAEGISGTPMQSAAMPHSHEPRQSSVQALTRTCDHGAHITMSHAHQASGPCSICALCYSAGAIAAAAVAAPSDRQIVVSRTIQPASDAATRFLTGGIERPPRFFLA